MKTKKKLRSHHKHQDARIPLGMQKTQEVAKSRLPKEIPTNTFTPMEIGAPDTDRVPGLHNPLDAEDGLGPLNMDGEGERQNDQIAELEQIEPKK